MGTSAFRIDNLTVSLGTPPTEILRGVSIDVVQGETLALVGKSGSGKSTLVNVLSGLIEPTNGTIESAVGRFGTLRTATVFQTANLFPWLSAIDNVALSLRLKNHPTRERKKSQRRVRALEIMKVLGIEEFADRRADELSGGQQQRVSIARAVAADPDVLLLDEPFSALDVATRASLQEWLVEHRKDLAPTVLLVTHDLSEALYVADRIALMSADPGALKVWSSDVRGRHEVTNSSVRAEIEERFFSAVSMS
jgi:ABC-type nitrate/sulfonate/bicarbonate transport system ATPase subunit